MRAPHSEAAGYTAVAKTLHWLVVLALIGQYTLAWTMPHIGRNTRPDTLINLHFSLGVLILFLVIVRLVWRWTHLEPTPLDGVPPWQVRSAQVVHGLLYLLLIVIPILGWANASFRGYDVTVFGLFTMPALLAARAPGWNWTGDVHALIANYLLLAVIALHVLAALYHALVRRDGVLERMLPAGWSINAR